jgi:hypothetical protein
MSIVPLRSSSESAVGGWLIRRPVFEANVGTAKSRCETGASYYRKQLFTACLRLRQNLSTLQHRLIERRSVDPPNMTN